ncbi:hypothetical protein [Mycobacterium phage SWU1]|uniref:Gene 76 protein n=2 Tax=Fromanvirus TaxID=186764 RepID=VG76_BPML5|nr:site-specific recombination directionality factor RDF [Fromanvirus L5]YP_006383001.1 site-specific recombination directionality factor RDF [Mycobacterium phage SWU1]Q05291.1 RecName: Full=Gene 76 protein; AltName: Full=Gp76 [Fromanvirus L5]AFI24991.1 hypothetical protein [Mycobacterium phage SWU1]CAA79452.1 Hypothetical Protein PBI_L5_76 [Fromanvirus L5]
MKAWHVVLLMCLAVVLGNLPGIIAEASASPLCEYRSAAHIAEHGGKVADDAWHIKHGELPSCDESPKGEARRDNDNRDGGKSRFCRKRWYC